MFTIPDGHYPFIDQHLPLAQMAMVEAPPRLEALFKGAGCPKRHRDPSGSAVRAAMQIGRLSRCHIPDLVAGRVRKDTHVGAEEICDGTGVD